MRSKFVMRSVLLNLRNEGKIQLRSIEAASTRLYGSQVEQIQHINEIVVSNEQLGSMCFYRKLMCE